jgi:hypothetical protein
MGTPGLFICFERLRGEEGYSQNRAKLYKRGEVTGWLEVVGSRDDEQNLTVT